jgi:hypothetical protein
MKRNNELTHLHAQANTYTHVHTRTQMHHTLKHVEQALKWNRRLSGRYRVVYLGFV